jgi:hypothetical protein
MLNKFITNMKEKSLRKQSEAIDERGIDPEGGGMNEDNSEINKGTEEEKTQKRNSMIIRVVVVIGLAYFFVTEFVLKKEEIIAPPVAAKPRRPKKEVVAEKEVAAEKVDTVPVENPIENPPMANPPPPVEEILPPVENINITEKKNESLSLPKSEEIVSDVPDKGELAPQVGEVKVSETLVDKKIDSLIDSVDNAGNEMGEASKKVSASLEDKIVADDTYIPPPGYDLLGRGLVYNCKEKHWACLDKASYVTCNKNNKWNKSHGKPAECVVQNVYNSDEDCGVVQKYNVSTNKSTSFCSEN